jgi:hypothetical protein
VEGESNGSKKHACTIKLPVCTCSRQSDAQDEDLDRSRPGGRGGAVTVATATATAAVAAACAGLVGAVLFSDCFSRPAGNASSWRSIFFRSLGGRRVQAWCACGSAPGPLQSISLEPVFFLRPRPTYPTYPPTLPQPNQISLVC